MKQLNKLYNILNIISIITLQKLIIGNEIDTLGPVFEKLVNTIIITITLLNIIFNITISIKNIRNKENKIGITSILISVLFAFAGITTIYGLIPFITAEILYLITFILSCFILIINRKNTDTSKKKSIRIYLIIMVIGYIIISLIPNILVQVNVRKFEKISSILSKQSDIQIIVYQEDEFCKIYDINGNLISTNNYEYVKSYEIIVNGKVINLIGVKDTTGLWIVDYKGQKIEKFYTLFENADDFFDRFIFIIRECGYRLKYNDKYDTYQNYMKKDNTKSTESELYFTDINTDMSLLVEFNYNEQIDLKNNKFFEAYKKYLEEEWDEEIVSNYEELYKYNKKYYLINNKTNEKHEMDCQNIIFSGDEDGDLAVVLYSNGYIPYFDNDYSGYFNFNGEKISFNSSHIVCDTLENYQIIKNVITDDYFIKLNNQKEKMINIGSYITFYGNDFIDTSEYTYIINKNILKKLSENECYDVEFINIDINNKINIYEEIGIIN